MPTAPINTSTPAIDNNCIFPSNAPLVTAPVMPLMLNVPTVKKMRSIPMNIPISPTRFVRKAFLHAFAAEFFSNQKPINKYELKPTNSQNKYIIIKLFDKIIPFMENVNKPKNAKYLE